MKSQGITVGQAFRDFEAFKHTNFPPGQRAFYDGPMDPLKRMAEQIQRELETEIAAAGGIEAWRAQHHEPAHA
ncbi:MAG: hypothetical protein PHW78_06725 [Macromonas bipunctata]|nr:hypothetical protein [Macromonas bipunctata]